MSTNGQSPATKEDLANLRSDMAKDMANLRSDMAKDMANLRSDMAKELANLRSDMARDLANLKDELLEAVSKLVYDSETRLLKAFYGFAESNRKEIADLTRSDSSLRERLDTIEDRLLAVEKRLNFPPRPSPPAS
jgi:uncharacterized phage infection (PIP) family protein YhgE